MVGPELRTRRLVLRPFAREDAAAIAAILDVPEVGRYLLHVPRPYTDVEAVRWLTSWTRRWLMGRGAAFAIIRRGRLCGAITLAVSRVHKRGELGYWLGADDWGVGLATEAATAVLAWGFRDQGLMRIHAQYLDDNRASGRVLEKIGMLREGVRRAHLKKGKRLLDAHQYGVLRQEWEARWQDK